MTKERKAEVMQQFATHEGDTRTSGSANRTFDGKNQSSERASKAQQKRSSFSSWSIADGWPSPRACSII